jgi:hypothetical protein
MPSKPVREASVTVTFVCHSHTPGVVCGIRAERPRTRALETFTSRSCSMRKGNSITWRAAGEWTGSPNADANANANAVHARHACSVRYQQTGKTNSSVHAGRGSRIGRSEVNTWVARHRGGVLEKRGRVGEADGSHISVRPAARLPVSRYC